MAVKAVPKLVTTETDPLIFYRCEQGNIWSAAKRLVLHWTLRRQVFGEERWLRRMDLTGTGAMNADDITLIHTGMFAVASSSVLGEKCKQQTLVVNFSRLNGRDPGSSRHRVFMFLMYSLNAYTQENGLTVLMSLPGSGVRVRSDNGKMLKESHRSQVFWVKNIFLIHDPNDSRQMLVRTFAAMIASIVKKVLDRVVPQMIVAPDRAISRYLLEMHSVDPHLVPEHLGGLWSYEYFDAWLDGLLRERKTEATVQHSQETVEYAPVIGTSLILQASRELQRNMRRKLPQHVIRLRDAQSAKYRYEKRKQEAGDLRTHEQELRRQNHMLQVEHRRLETLLDHALSLIQKLN